MPPHDRPAPKKRRISSSATEMRSAIEQPGSIKINAAGAYIVDHTDGEITPPSSGANSPSEEKELSYQHHKRDIRLPNHNTVVSHVAADIGGSLAKVVYFSRERGNTESGGRLEFLSFETDKIDDCIAYLRSLRDQYQQSKAYGESANLSIIATGGGAFKFYDQIKERLGVDVFREDEMDCLIQGLNFFITEIPNEVFTYHDETPDNAMQFEAPMTDVYPYFLVNIGSGVSMIKVSGPSQFQRIGGTSLGGGTLWGLLSLLTGARTFDDMLAMADKGDNSAVDLLVGDIYGSGTGYEKIGLGERAIASSFGKVLRRKRKAERDAEDGSGMTNGDESGPVEQTGRPTSEKDAAALVQDGRMFRPEDISRSLLYAISNNIGQIAYLQSEKHDVQRIYFGGSFIRGHQQTIHTLSYAIKFWSKGAKQAYFVRHEGYLGAVGAFLKRKPVNFGRRGSVEFIDV